MTTATGAAVRIAAARLDWIVPDWPAPDTVEAFVTTRNSRDDAGRVTTFDPGGHVVAPDPAVASAERADRARLARFVPAEPRWLEQVHGAEVVHMDPDVVASTASAASPHAPRADAAVTRAPEVVLAVRAADCLPVFFCDRAGTVVGAAHAGWRGLAAGVLENTVAALDCDPRDVLAWMGPAIGRDAFEVGAEVMQAFTAGDAGAAAAFVPGRSTRWYADLEALARRRLARAGVSDVFGGGMCTNRDSARFYSWRRERSHGRMAALIWIARDLTAGGALGAVQE